MPTPRDNDSDARSARRFLLALGFFFAGLAIACLAFPSWNVPGHAMPVCAMLAVTLVGFARFVPDAWVRRLENIFIGWP
ncbi:hypothetical protein [Povalibacter sp.]|uniref:hypothetical protein n=1 Tax=Povalibacter sp. TaxID=1962978 RepID=UPI002F413A73